MLPYMPSTGGMCSAFPPYRALEKLRCHSFPHWPVRASSATAMQIRTLAVFGITGQTGEALVNAAAVRGWAVRGFARPESATPRGPAAPIIVRGYFTDSTRVVEAVAGADAVCCVIGPRAPYTEVFCAAATAAIVQAMRQVGSRRLVCQTGAMVGPGNRTPAFEWFCRSFARRRPAVAQDRLEQEGLIRECGLDWTLVKPPRLTNGPARHAVKAGCALRVGLLSSISRADIAEFMLDAIEGAQYVCARVFVRG